MFCFITVIISIKPADITPIFRNYTYHYNMTHPMTNLTVRDSNVCFFRENQLKLTRTKYLTLKRQRNKRVVEEMSDSLLR